MKKSLSKLCLGLFLLTSGAVVQAQTYEPPSREMVETLLEKVNTCKRALADLEDSIEFMENNPENYTLAQYNEAKTYKKMAEGCIADARRDLEELRKKFPGWFNSPSATVDLGKGIHVGPKDLDKKLKEIETKINKLLARLGNVQKPSN